MIGPQAGMKWQRHGSRVTDEDLVEAAFRMLNKRSPAHSLEPGPDCLAPGGKLVIDTPDFQASLDWGGIQRLTSTLPEDAVFGYCEALRDGTTVIGRFTAGGFGPEPAFGRYMLRRRGDRIERLRLEIEPGLDRELSASMAWQPAAWEAGDGRDHNIRRDSWAAAPNESGWWRQTMRDSTTPVPIMLWVRSLFKRPFP